MDKAIIDNLILEVKKEALKKGCELTLPTIGASMFPLLSSHNKITAVKCNFEELKLGDLILFKFPTNNGTLVAHRLIRKIKNENSYTFITKGDAVFNPDKPITQDAVLGKIIKIKKKYFNISFETFMGRMIGRISLLLSITRINYLGLVFLRNIKYLIKISI